MTEDPIKIALVGRPNVGKSTLFNRLIGRRQAIVDDFPGVTRDRQYASVEWQGRTFEVIDTGGLLPLAKPREFSHLIREQVFLALEEAQLVFFVVDGRQGLTSLDQEVGQVLRRQEKPVILVVNKIDRHTEEALVADFYPLGFSETIAVSAESSRGVSDLLDQVLKKIPKQFVQKKELTDFYLAILGQPNVGKSTLLNYLMGAKRAVVHGEAGTTLDSLRYQFKKGGRNWELVDTAGIRRKNRTQKKLEKISVIKALQQVEKVNLIWWLVDAQQSMSAQDVQILGYALERGKGVLLVLNKWDVVSKEQTIKKWLEKAQGRYPWQQDLLSIAISAKTGRGVQKMLELTEDLKTNYERRIGTGELNRVFQDAVRRHPHPSSGGRNVNLFYITQSQSSPPGFVIFCNHPRLVTKSYLRYLENQFRSHFEFSGVPLRLWLRKRKS